MIRKEFGSDPGTENVQKDLNIFKRPKTIKKYQKDLKISE
jgi:hypothetical protein